MSDEEVSPAEEKTTEMPSTDDVSNFLDQFCQKYVSSHVPSKPTPLPALDNIQLN